MLEFEYRLNRSNDLTETLPDVTSMNDGGYVFVWQSKQPSGDIYSPVGEEESVEFNIDAFWGPSIEQLPSGDLLVSSTDYSGRFAKVLITHYTSLGAPTGVSHYVGEDEGYWNGQQAPTIAVLASGNYVVVFDYHSTSSHFRTAIGAQIFDSGGDSISDVFVVAESAAYHQFPKVSAKPDGGFVVAWIEMDDSYDINYRLFNQLGESVSQIKTAHSTTESSQAYPSIAVLSNNEFVISWETSDKPSIIDQSIFARKFNNEGTAVTAELLVSANTEADNEFPSSAVFSDDSFIIVWESAVNNTSNILGQYYDASAIAVGEPFIVSNEGGHDSEPSVEVLDNDDFVVAYRSAGHDGIEAGVFAKRFSKEGTPIQQWSDTELVYQELSGSDSDDVLVGTSGYDNIIALLGVDVVDARESDDLITLSSNEKWGKGFAAINVGDSASIGTNGTISLVDYFRFDDVINGGDGADSLVLTSSSDALFLDDIYSEHHDSIVLSSTSRGMDSTARIIDLEVIYANAGDDLIDLTSSDFNLNNNVEIHGGAGNDVLWASIGDDLLVGGDGNDTLCGAAGGDSLSGGTGQDTFQFTATSSNDLITDFSFVELDALEFYYRANNPSNIDDLDLSNGVITWNSGDESRLVQIDLSATVQSSDINDFSDLISFHEIV
jgi:Ca2+-binding RTX toxin-like protein